MLILIHRKKIFFNWKHERLREAVNFRAFDKLRVPDFADP